MGCQLLLNLPKRGKWIVILIVCMSSAQNGFFYSWAGGGLRFILNGEAGIVVTEQEHTFILNTFLVSKIVGVVAVSFAMDRFGRKWTLMFFSLFAVLGWSLLLFGTNALCLVIARVLCGLYVSIQLSLIPVIIGETMESDMRGTMSTLSVFFSIAANLSLSLMVSTSYTVYNVITGLPSLALVVSSLFMVETPYFILMKGDKENARRSIVWLRGSASDDQLDSMEDHCKRSESLGRFSRLLDKNNRRAFTIVIPLVLAVSITTLEVSYNYLFVIMPSKPISAETTLIIGNLSCALALIVSAFILEKLGRKSTTVMAFLGACIFDTILAVWFFNENSVAHLGWIPSVSLCLKSFFFYLALETLPRLMLSELFSIQVKGAAAVVVTVTKATITIAMNQAFYPIRNNVGVWLYYVITAVFSCLGGVVAYFLLPETKGRTLEKIQDDLTNGVTNGKTIPRDYASTRL